MDGKWDLVAREQGGVFTPEMLIGMLSTGQFRSSEGEKPLIDELTFPWRNKCQVYHTRFPAHAGSIPFLLINPQA